MQLLNMIAYYISKEQHDNEHVNLVEPENGEIDIENERATKFVDEIRKSYRKDTGNYAEFDQHSQFKGKLARLHDQNEPFTNVSYDLIVQLRDLLIATSASTGGHLIYIRYQEGDQDFFMVVMLKAKEGFAFDRKVDLIDASYLDLSHLHLAARVDISAWKAGEHRYISFLSGRSREDVTDYFKAYVGIDTQRYEDAKENTRELRDALIGYCHEHEYDIEREGEIRRKIFDYALSKYEAEEPVELDVMARIIEPENPDQFIRFCNSDDIQLQGQFHISRRELKTFTRYSGRDKELSISFEHDSIGSRVKVDLDNDTLIIQGIPPKLRESLSPDNGQV